MAKLEVQNTAGFNAGKTFYAKPVRVSDIIIDPEIAGIFDISDNILEDIKNKIKKHGYNKEEPVVIWKGRNILVDGRTRYTAVKDLGEEEIPAVEREFETREEAILYTIERQVLRRNLCGPEMLKAVRMISLKQGGAKYGGGQVKQIAERLGVGTTTIYQAQAVLREGTKEEIAAVERGELSIKQGYAKTAERNPRKPVKAFGEAAAPCPPAPAARVEREVLPEGGRFLSDAVILLIEEGQQTAAELLIKHFLPDTGKEGFYRLLPQAVREHLEDSSGGICQ